MAFVKQLNEDESVESMLKRFKKKLAEENIVKDYKKHQFFIKKSAIRHENNIKRKRYLQLEKIKKSSSKAH